MINLPIRIGAAGAAPLIAPPGCAILLVARKGTTWISDVLQAIDNQDAAASQAICQQLNAQLDPIRVPGVSAEDALEAVTHSEEALEELLPRLEVFGELRYRGEVIALPALHLDELPELDGIDIYAWALPFNGGDDILNHLEMLEYWTGTPGAELEVALVAQEPNLTPFEQDLLTQAAANDEPVAIGEALTCPFVTGIVVVTVYVVLTTIANGCAGTQMNQLSVTQDDVDNLGRQGSLDDLLDQRNEIILSTSFA